MNPEQAIESIKYNYPPESQRIFRLALDMGIEALEKQIAKKVVSRPGYYLHKCPSCDYRQTVDRDEYCWHCGQKLDWSDAE